MATFTEEILEEIELSNIRKSSNDDVEYALDVIDRLIHQLSLREMNNSDDCGCTYCN